MAAKLCIIFELLSLISEKKRNFAPMEAFPALNLPAASLRYSKDNSAVKVFDPLRRRYVRLTPEEWVRPHVISYLINHKHYPAGLLGNEISLNLNGTSRRCDTVLFGLDRQPLMIVEYKASHVPITQKVFDQISRYNIVLRTPWLVVSNGLQHIVCHIDLNTQTYEFLPEIPDYEAITDRS